MRTLSVWFLWSLLTMGSHVAAEDPESRESGSLIWLRNQHLSVGLLPSSGGAISRICRAGSEDSLINSFDRGRLIQQSWYGQDDGSLWNGQPWKWNPVQGGDWKGKSARILEQRHQVSESWIRSRPVHWATGEELADCDMEQTVTLLEEVIQVTYRFRYTGTHHHPARHQELPAFFVNPQFDTLVIGDTRRPDMPLTRLKPGWPNEYHPMPDHWAAWVDQNGFGIGCRSTAAEELTCYRFQPERHSPSACSYFAPIRTIAVIPGFDFQYNIQIAIGTIDEIRKKLQKVREAP